MKRISKKLLFSVAALLLISLSSFAMLSFTMADEENEATESSSVVRAAGTGTITQIDRIIDNSINGTYGDKNYHIVEISSGAVSSLQTLVSNGVFKNLVIDGFRTINEVMADGTVSFEPYSIGSTDSATLVSAIQNADFIYVHNDPAKMFSATNDLTEDVKLALSSAATGDYKPFMIDSYTKTYTISNNSTYTYNKIIKNDFNSKLATYSWPSTLTVEQFMGLQTGQAYFIPIHGNTAAANGSWQSFKKTDDTAYNLARVLTISNGASTLTDKLKDGIPTADITVPADLADGVTMDVTGVKEFPSTAPLYIYGYYSREKHPDFIKFDTVSYSDLSTVNLNNYDFIVIESDVSNLTVNSEVSTSLTAAAFAKVHILYDSSLSGTAASSVVPQNPAPCYAYVLDKVATSAEVPRFPSVLVTDAAKMGAYTKATIPKTVKEIADIIINGSFRGIKNNSGDDTSNIYTVLEIEPSYPVDTALAKAFYDKKTYNVTDPVYNYKGNNKTFIGTSGRASDVLFTKYGDTSFYYLRSDGVVDASADEVSFDGTTALSAYHDDNTNVTDQTQVENAVNTAQTTDATQLNDYYNWTMSKAKIAHAVGLGYNQVKVVHMSSAELNSCRLSLADTYDAIYIGGNNSGIKNPNKWQNGGAYTMYFNDGDTNTTVASSNGSYRSNDISDAKYSELLSYAKVLPVIVDKSVTDAIAAGTGVSPASNMYKAITGVQTATYTLWGFDSTKTQKIANVDDEYGTTYGGYVTVFNGSREKFNYDDTPNEYADNGNHSIDEDALADRLTKAQRPKLILSSMPKLYVDNDESTWITKNDFSWKYEISGATDVTAKVYVDDNANGQFESTEERARMNGASGTLTPSPGSWIGDDFFGPIYWKFIAVNNQTGASVSTTGISKVKRTTQEKMKVDLLEIVPVTEKGDNALSSLFLCTECQYARKLVDNGNINAGGSAGGKYGKHAIEQLAQSFDDDTEPSPINGTSENLLRLSDAPAGGGDGRPASITVYYQNTSGPIFAGTYTYYAAESLNKGRTLTLSGLAPGVLRVGDQSNAQTVNVTSGGTTISGVTVEIPVASDGIVKIQYPPDASASTGTSSTKYIVDYLKNADDTYDYSEHGNTLGIHEHKFGIVKYDTHEKRTNNPNGCDYEGLDNWNTNWFLQFENDYDVDTTIWSIDDYQDWCSKVNTLYEGLDDDQIDVQKETFSQKASDYQKYYNCMVEVINGIYFTAESQISATDKADFVKFLKETMKLGASFNSNKLKYTNTPSDDDVEEMLKAFAGAGSRCDSYLVSNKNAFINDSAVTQNNTAAQSEAEINWITDSNVKYDDKAYYFLYSHYRNNNENFTPGFTPYYIVWRDAKILEQFFHYEYMSNNLSASVFYGDNSNTTNHGKFDLSNAFNCIAIGAAENFGDKDINEEGCYTLLNYINNDGHLILFHDTLTVDGLRGGGTKNMTKILGEAFGQAKPSDSTTLKNGYSLTQRSLQFGSKGSEHNLYYISPQKYNYYDYETETNNQMMHGSHDVRDSIRGIEGYGVTSDKANQVNEGVITEYPFTIDSRLQISPTASSGFTANVDNNEMVVYYTISGGTLGTKSSMYAANPNDGANNYFLYQYRNVTYTGAGHSIITGLGRDNNDERKLFINVILNSARMSTAGPTLSLHDIDSKIEYDEDGKIINDGRKNKVIKEAIDANQETDTGTDKEEYVTYVSSTDDLPEFTFFPTATSGISEVKIWYDVRNNGDSEKNIFNDTADSSGNKDVLIYDITSNFDANNVISERLKKITTDTGPQKLEGYQINADGSIVTKLNLKDSYFTGKMGEAAYIVVQLTDGKGKTVTKTLRIELKPELLELN